MRIIGVKGSSVVDCVNKIRVLVSGLEGAGIQPLNTTLLSILMIW